MSQQPIVGQEGTLLASWSLLRMRTSKDQNEQEFLLSPKQDKDNEK